MQGFHFAKDKITAKDRFLRPDSSLKFYARVFANEEDFFKIQKYLNNNLLIYSSKSNLYEHRLEIDFYRHSYSDKLDDIINDTERFLSPFVYSNSDISLAQEAVQLVNLKAGMLSVAESITGGMISSMLIDISGASSMFYEGCVTYSNESKMNRLDVKSQTLIDFGAVSKQTAHEMCEALLSQEKCSYAISTTGIAGPGGATLTKPVGLCYIAVGKKGKDIVVKEFVFEGERNNIRKKAAQTALFMLIDYINSYC
jgi:PncC family amidohydrolase